MTRRPLALVLAVLAFAVVVAACGGGDDEEAEPAGGGGGAAQTLQIAADPGGDLAFDKTSLEASGGEFAVDFTNESTVPHNFTIEGEDVATSTFTEGMESVTATLEPGTYTFFCSVPGHREAGMEGTLTVR